MDTTNSFMNLLYFLHMMIICCNVNILKSIWENQIKKLLTFLVESMEMSGWTSQYWQLVLNICRESCNALNMLYVFR